METFMHLSGLDINGPSLNFYQMGIRAIIVFFIALIFIRIAGMRVFGKKSSFDIVLGIVLGALLSRGITGASPFFATIFASFVFVMMHRLMAYLSFKSHKAGRIIKGTPSLLFKDGEYLAENMERSLITKHDIDEALREKVNTNDLGKIKEAYYERNGEIGFVTK